MIDTHFSGTVCMHIHNNRAAEVEFVRSFGTLALACIRAKKLNGACECLSLWMCMVCIQLEISTGKLFTDVENDLKPSILCVCVCVCEWWTNVLLHARVYFLCCRWCWSCFTTSNSIDVIYQSYGKQHQLTAIRKLLMSTKQSESVQFYILLSSNFDMNIDLMSVFICHHVYYIVYNGKLTVVSMYLYFFCSSFFSLKNHFDGEYFYFIAPCTILLTCFFPTLLLTQFISIFHTATIFVTRAFSFW